MTTDTAETPPPIKPNPGTMPTSASNCQLEACPSCGAVYVDKVVFPCQVCRFDPAGQQNQRVENISRQLYDVAAEPQKEPGLLTAVPPWLWLLLAGCAGIFTLTFMTKLSLDRTGTDPFFVAWLQLLAGLTSALLAHVIACRYAMSRDRRLNLNDALLAWAAIWQPTLVELPVGRRRVFSFLWGITAAFASIAILGGHRFNSIFDPGEQTATVAVTPSVEALTSGAGRGAKEKTLESALQDVAGHPENSGGDAGANPGAHAGPGSATDQDEHVLACQVFGYQADKAGRPLRFLFLGTPRHEKMHVATLPVEDLEIAHVRQIAARLSNTVVRNPAVQTRYRAIWVRPEVTCRLKYDEIAADGTLLNPRIESVVSPQENAEEAPASDSALTTDESPGFPSIGSDV